MTPSVWGSFSLFWMGMELVKDPKTPNMVGACKKKKFRLTENLQYILTYDMVNNRNFVVYITKPLKNSSILRGP